MAEKAHSRKSAIVQLAGGELDKHDPKQLFFGADSQNEPEP